MTTESQFTHISVQGFHTDSYSITPSEWRVSVIVAGKAVSVTKHRGEDGRERALALAESMANLLDLLGQKFTVTFKGRAIRTQADDLAGLSKLEDALAAARDAREGAEL